MLLEGLDTLFLLATEGTMGKVASRLYISQSAVSKRISQLEQRLGKKLIEPDGRQIRLTPQAHELLTRLAPTLAEMKGLLADSQTLTDAHPLPVACSETLLAGYLAPFMADYLRQDPYLLISTHHTPVILARVRAGEALLGICAGRLPPGHGLHAELLRDEPFYLVGSEEERGPAASLFTMDLDNPVNRYLVAPLAELGLAPRMQLDSYLALIELAKAGMGPVMLPEGLLALVGEQGKQARPLPGISRPIHLIYRPSSLKRDRASRLIQALTRHFAQLRPLSG
ncbi:DNA-binding transcriptional LysR family regulator [Aeromonas sp. BIGb0405]|jgi:DNA-binding transcriptional LysR family regulator|uniref:LysR family transcriptional regulator n=1 Tax=Aeromonas TaxID=642 RepID=UPI001CD00817|nr:MULTISPECIES: LysR family transcriptional regulator [Aeromonas]MCS3453966.1 DNA-binding transcriptional LysR family regulator [Aeromonas sp. BIGb0405]MCS3459845.1 DNA-binding transcriptional LysR family regulator [Aeromonas sp. BIGb0445]UBO75741.1 LysR family transcriptional regulator [Aeromonas rivuli]